MNLSDSVWQHWQTAKDFAHQKMTALNNSAQMLGQSLQETATKTTDHTINAVTQTFNQSRQTAEQLQNIASQTVQTALLNPTESITSALNDWLIQHPTLWRLMQILDWAANHPIISLVVLLFALTLVWNIIKAIMGLIEKASWSVLQIPLKLIQTVFKLSFFSLVKIFSLVTHKTNNHQPISNNLVSTSSAQPNFSEKQQRLAEIALRLETIQKEQKELLQEASTLIAQNSLDIKIPNVIRNSHQA